MSKTYYVYILASKKNGTLYIGVTNDISRRVWEHKEKIVKGFTQKYNDSPKSRPKYFFFIGGFIIN
jgi:predicted GIY-YIG superfamily endonuclease